VKSDETEKVNALTVESTQSRKQQYLGREQHGLPSLKCIQDKPTAPRPTVHILNVILWIASFNIWTRMSFALSANRPCFVRGNP
jgi:hypothetical protein